MWAINALAVRLIGILISANFLKSAPHSTAPGHRLLSHSFYPFPLSHIGNFSHTSWTTLQTPSRIGIGHGLRRRCGNCDWFRCLQFDVLLIKLLVICNCDWLYLLYPTDTRRRRQRDFFYYLYIRSRFDCEKRWKSRIEFKFCTKWKVNKISRLSRVETDHSSTPFWCTIYSDPCLMSHVATPRPLFKTILFIVTSLFTHMSYGKFWQIVASVLISGPTKSHPNPETDPGARSLHIVLMGNRGEYRGWFILVRKSWHWHVNRSLQMSLWDKRMHFEWPSRFMSGNRFLHKNILNF